jgi:hypothetical protein
MRIASLALSIVLLLAGCNDGGEYAANNTSMNYVDDPVMANEATADPKVAAAPAYCPEVKIMTTPADCDYFTRLRADASQGLGAFNAPREMWKGETVPIQLAVSMAPNAELVAQYSDASNVVAEADAALEDPVENKAEYIRDTDSNTAASVDEPGDERPPPVDRLAGPAQTVRAAPGATVPFVPIVGRFMRAELSGGGFDVKPLSPRDQEVTEGGTTVWNWEVTPTAALGAVQRLTLTTAVLATGSDGKVRVLSSSVTNKSVVVQVTAVERARAALKEIPVWIGYLTAIVGALAALFLAWRKLRGGKGGDA